MKKGSTLTAYILAVAIFLVGCQKSGEEEISHSENSVIEVAAIIKATSSDFWQYVLVGAENYGVVHPGVNIKTYGPSAESEVAQQVTILEDVISTQPDVIVLAATSSDAANNAIDSARSQGIVVITIDNKVTTDSDAFLATDNIKGGEKAAEHLVQNLLNNQDVSSPNELTGSIIIVTAISGQLVLENRNQGFIDYIKENAPQLKFLNSVDINNDMALGMSSFESVLDANPDLVGVFANNNVTGGAVGRVLESRNRTDIIAIAFDSDEIELQAIADGWLKATVVQDPYRMGYEGVELGLQKLAGLDIPNYVDTGAVLVTAQNVDEGSMQTFLNPRKKALAR